MDRHLDSTCSHPHLNRRPWISTDVSGQPHGQTNSRKDNSPGPSHPNSLSLDNYDWSSLAHRTQTRLQSFGDCENYWPRAPLAVGSLYYLAGRSCLGIQPAKSSAEKGKEGVRVSRSLWAWIPPCLKQTNSFMLHEPKVSLSGREAVPAGTLALVIERILT